MSSPYPANSVEQIISGASGFIGGPNPAYTISDFCDGTEAFFPQFKGKVEPFIVNQFIAMANATVKERRWRTSWRFAMSLFVAHFCTLYLETTGTDATPAAEVISSAQARGLITSESVGDVSYSQDFSQIATDLEGWAMWKTTQYGIQFASMAKLLGKGGGYIY